MVRNIVIILILVPLAIVFFAPKRELYYLLEQKLQEKNLVISAEDLDAKPLGIDVNHPTVYVSGLPVATADKFDIWSILYTTYFTVTGAKVAEGFPQEVTSDEISASNIIAIPFDLSISGVSSLGDVSGDINLGDRVVRINIGTTKLPEYYNKIFKKDEEGVYYESNF